MSVTRGREVEEELRVQGITEATGTPRGLLDRTSNWESVTSCQQQ